MSAQVQCNRIEDDVVGLLAGTASDEIVEHVATCDTCRDKKHELEAAAQRAARAGDDFVLAETLADRLAEIAREAQPERTSVTRMRGSQPAPGVAPTPSPPSAKKLQPSKKAIALIIAACVSVGGSIAAGLLLADRHSKSPEVIATRPWHGKVTKIARSGADKTGGLFIQSASGKSDLAEGAEIKSGMKLWTDGRTRARIELDDGSFLVLDRATKVTVDGAPRTLVLEDGALLADVAHVDGAPPAKIKTDAGWVKILGTKVSVTAAADRTNVEVLRGEVEVGGKGPDTEHVAAGQEGVLAKDGRIDVAPANDLAQRAAFGEQLLATHNEDLDAPVSGLGELRARRPGQTNEKDHAVRLAQHAVKIRIAGNVARTEIDETFTNDTSDELEGIYRFPLPPGAQIERLALEVDGKLVDGEFVDKAKAAAIWRGAIQNAAPQIKQREEIVWVPGPWHDPALLEWQRGGRFELKIFPIPKKGSRRVVIAYTETVAPVSGIRRYVYPLPQGSSSQITIDNFSVDAQVVGHDGKGVTVKGYELDRKTEGGTDKLNAAMTAFTPSGDLAIEYALADRTTDATAWAYADPNPPQPKAKEKDPIGADPFVAIALRPKLPKWADVKPRDQVIVVDAGRAMFGERFQRARRLAQQIAQEMDRRDRVTVLACDVTCKAMPGGFVAPGAPAAHDVDAFLAGVSPDGASDLVGAVRAAAKTPHDSARDLRVVIVSDGVATAGYRSGQRVANEVRDALADGRGEVVTVPLGADADTVLLGEIARGGGGVVVPYQPGQRLEASAIEVLNATYGTTLRDVEVILPDGLRDVAPAQLPPLRAGSEAIVTARMRAGEPIKGDIILKGKVGGDPFEAKYPVEIAPTTDAGNAFVPRLFAAARIADHDREPGDSSKTELVALSQRFAVPSRFTSLLVLESEAMFKAFGIDRNARGATWTGEQVGVGHVVATIEKPAPLNNLTSDPFGGDAPARGVRDAKDKEAKKSDSSADEVLGGAVAESEAPSLHGSGAGGGGFAGPSATTAPPPASPAPVAKAAAPRAMPADDLSAAQGQSRLVPPNFDGRRGGRFMKRIFVRHAAITTDPTPAVSAEKVAKARSEVAATPDERSKHKELARVLALSGQLDELGEVLEKWQTRDPLDADVVVARADLAARKGDREGALRILGGALAASAMSTSDAAQLATTISRGYDRLGKPEACAFAVAAAELDSSNADRVARAVSCERTQGHTGSADRWLGGLKDAQRTAVNAALAKTDTRETATGDVIVSASWDGGADLDVAVLDPAGRRASAVSRMKGARVEGAQSRDHETLGLATGEAGPFVVEVVRANASETTPVSGRVTIRAFGQTQTVPFTLTGARSQVARVDVRWDAELVAVDDDTLGEATFDRSAAASSLARVPVQQCGASGQAGTGHVMVTFGPSGRVQDVVVDDASFAGTPAGRCVMTAFFNARVPSFVGAPVRVGKSFTIR